ncbi:hypothetical protein A2331_03585 [Candidatus Falkowbacteria bacterium RIFOXYB2_FULL_34_18]|uniref:Uncharacterized protein n=1 Tax=Candidatus Falkowbacteria bacterium RIFOXYD2_FULL_34_120 TaxID=1798007 RepID=A0A1F5TS82_9BACT|nr:MAG: hypothetical protein A2331_03585 [Candidatus Falkowbacteria bacterium RIFOXYB2_FULL_34_18]OGF30097.1 MAG: hypothetical protein A2500_04865 [Candidatus Falkowbacteria bacterium RIFOXYC12_FULL_34_55]OGF37569.1 MAG: hypothetical protein A2466_01980 [Candidatus Falkowbacteria bacterium RIFOXYC2_FULL_34_220]OGF39325.1 MAG: hypothetical protein A2515_02395 [Candidatus Falkowbacteria bacterium RIFOXYD12_FULL_34_57]OGF41830.1 MAG: hypothetical protein A2531_05380 [Candidatus Falkowbacteria bact
MYKIFLKNSGQSILELVIALGVFLIIITVFTDFIYGNFVLLERGSDYVQAEAIAKEEIEAIRSIKKMTWNEFLYSTSSVSVLNNRWVLNGEGVIGNVGKFFYSSSFYPVYRNTQKDIVEELDGEEDILTKRMKTFIEWETSDGVSAIIEKNSYISAWNSKKWLQTNWSGGPGQSIWGDASKYESDDGNIDIGIGGQLRIVEVATSTYVSSGYAISSAFNTENNSSFVAIFWTENIPLGCDIKIQIKTAPDAGGIPGIWSATWSGPDGEDGNETDYYTVQSGQIINVDHNNDQWIKYKVLLTSDSINTPVLSEVSFYYQQ